MKPVVIAINQSGGKAQKPHWWSPGHAWRVTYTVAVAWGPSHARRQTHTYAEGTARSPAGVQKNLRIAVMRLHRALLADDRIDFTPEESIGYEGRT